MSETVGGLRVWVQYIRHLFYAYLFQNEARK